MLFRSVEKIVAEVMKRMENREETRDSAEQGLSPIEEAYVSIVRRHLKPVLEARAAEIEARRDSYTTRYPSGKPGIPDDEEPKTVRLRPRTTA